MPAIIDTITARRWETALSDYQGKPNQIVTLEERKTNLALVQAYMHSREDADALIALLETARDARWPVASDGGGE